jgi:hypothetical protein
MAEMRTGQPGKAQLMFLVFDLLSHLAASCSKFRKIENVAASGPKPVLITSVINCADTVPPRPASARVDAGDKG